jgi:hypothetical protein
MAGFLPCFLSIARRHKRQFLFSSVTAPFRLINCDNAGTAQHPGSLGVHMSSGLCINRGQKEETIVAKYVTAWWLSSEAIVDRL